MTNNDGIRNVVFWGGASLFLLLAAMVGDYSRWTWAVGSVFYVVGWWWFCFGGQESADATSGDVYGKAGSLRRIRRVVHYKYLGTETAPYMNRRYLLPRNPLLQVFLHEWLASDDFEVAYHGHPGASFSVLLRGRLIEHTPKFKRRLGLGACTWRGADFIHAIEVPPQAKPPLTLFIALDWRLKKWFFYCRDTGRILSPSEYYQYGCAESATVFMKQQQEKQTMTEIRQFDNEPAAIQAAMAVMAADMPEEQLPKLEAAWNNRKIDDVYVAYFDGRCIAEVCDAGDLDRTLGNLIRDTMKIKAKEGNHSVAPVVIIYGEPPDDIKSVGSFLNTYGGGVMWIYQVRDPLSSDGGWKNKTDYFR